MWVAGVDGCPGGWLMVLVTVHESQPPRLRLASDFAAVLATPEEPSIIAVDMPIGLPERLGPDGRGCDRAARAVLGERQSSLFAVPARAAVMAEDYREACAIAAQLSQPPRKVSKQCFYLFPKIRQIDRLMTPALQHRVREVHPEVAFWSLNGERPLSEPKKVKSRPHPAGLRLRRHLLLQGGLDLGHIDGTMPAAKLASADDLLDAAACAWVARSLAMGRGRHFPAVPSVDGRGLAMAIWTGQPPDSFNSVADK